METIEQPCRCGLTAMKISSIQSDLASEDARSPKTNDEEQLSDGEALLKCFSPLLSSMRVFGLYFTPVSSQRMHDYDASSSSTKTTYLKVQRRKWNCGHVYAVVMLAIAWLDAARNIPSVMLTRTFVSKINRMTRFVV